MTRRMTPMHDPAIMPLDVICHCEERKPGKKVSVEVNKETGKSCSQASIVYQFHSIWTWSVLV